ncbi:DUF2255 family protein [Formosa haliotis]|uniref:DUF2255 family protein n=1 Tax=Formosa haliotis TaxID=1555194 RepID=UPI00082473DC|nr:DUF2255 family protein [Formosa haliotis]
MSATELGLTAIEIDNISERNDFHIAPLREDGTTYGTLTWIWSVQVDHQLYVRAYHGKDSRWYQAAVNQKQGKIQAAGFERNVRFEPVSGDINAKIDEAYKEKYGDSPYLNTMINQHARMSSLRVY